MKFLPLFLFIYSNLIICDNIVEDFRQNNKFLYNSIPLKSNLRFGLSETAKKSQFLVEDACANNNQDCILAFQSIQMLHKQLDDDADGAVDFSESNDFLTEELKYDSGHVNKRQKAFHFNNDMQISVEELWKAWLQSEVHNWTVHQILEWLEYSVRLPQYSKHFLEHKVTGALLPRLAVNNMNFLSTVLGIKDPIHKHKLVLKAMDVVLFGSPKDNHRYWKDYLLMALLTGATFGAYYTYCQNKKSRRHLMRLMKDMESLQSAEQTLEQLQQELEEARIQKDYVANEKEFLEKKLQQANSSDFLDSFSDSDSELMRLKEEIEMLRNELKLAEGELKDRCWSAPLFLQYWLQFTYELENKTYLKTKMAAEAQLQTARDACEKLRKKRSTLVGSFVSTHGKNIDDVDKSIMEARNALSEVTFELQERSYRWKQIENLCGFRIMNNRGLSYLENVLYNNNSNTKFGQFLNSQRSSQDDNDDDSSSMYSQSTSEKLSNRAQSTPFSQESFSNVDNNTAINKTSDANTVDFFLGSSLLEINMKEISETKSPNIISQQKSRPTQISSANTNTNLKGKPKPKPPMIRSRSQDIQLPCSHVCDDWLNTVDGCSLLEQNRFQQQFLNQKNDQVDDENNSTDSSSLSNDDIFKKKSKNKLIFSSFAKKIKSKIN